MRPHPSRPNLIISFLCGGYRTLKEIRRPLERKRSIVQRSILAKAAVNQGGLCPLGDWAISLGGEIPPQMITTDV